eukprot:CAMPEP_0197875996 /NCGR_PEP_ID=MMETSP1439-20131203/5105_1 /TAXON_ID=66791 /ORGANISM="Gonyaulax spinifera, Strain CCMP409" /LENGTH=176 /DNA_ID=CAMNT_0043495255 /DNA_START=53 /DNA_END=580 /DNA_ORIENTATION=+
MQMAKLRAPHLSERDDRPGLMSSPLQLAPPPGNGRLADVTEDAVFAVRAASGSVKPDTGPAGAECMQLRSARVVGVRGVSLVAVLPRRWTTASFGVMYASSVALPALLGSSPSRHDRISSSDADDELLLLSEKNSTTAMFRECAEDVDDADRKSTAGKQTILSLFASCLSLEELCL